MSELREKLVAKKSTQELLRQANKARRKDYFTQEDLDLAQREATHMWESLKPCFEETPDAPL